MNDRPLDEYVEAEVQRALAEDIGVAEQGITVVRREHTIVLCGEVESAARRDEVVRVMGERFPDVSIETDIGVIRAGAPTAAEELT
jgi:hypothetical protein